jgi:DNA-binding transcriptional MocR family regulator
MASIACGWLDDGTVTRLEVEKRQDATNRQAIAGNVLRGLRYIHHPTSYFLWLPLAQEVRADQVAAALMGERISVSTAEPFTTSTQVPHAIRLALGSVELDALREALETVTRVINGFLY